MKNKGYRADLMLVGVAIIWGSGFIAVETAIEAGMSPLLILTLRFMIATIILSVVMAKSIKSITRKEWMKGSIAGGLLFLGFYTQTVGQSLTTISNSAFITGTYVLMVPFIVWIITRKKPELRIIVLALCTLIGVAVLTVSPGTNFTANVGDIYIMVCAVGFASHIAYLGIAVEGNSALKITFIQILVATVLSTFGLLVFEQDVFAGVDLSVGLPATIYLGVFTTTLCFFLQTYAQKYTTAARAGIIMSMEGLFGTLFSIVLGFEMLTARVVIGGIIILTSVILTEAYPGRVKEKDMLTEKGECNG